jgi:hypothetical protein
MQIERRAQLPQLALGIALAPRQALGAEAQCCRGRAYQHMPS